MNVFSSPLKRAWFAVGRRLALVSLMGLGSSALAIGVLSDTQEVTLPWVTFQKQSYRVGLHLGDGGERALSLRSAAVRSAIAPNGAAATLGDDNKLRVPLLSYQGELYTASLDYLAASGAPSFRVAEVAAFAWPAERGQLVSATLVGSKSREEMATTALLLGQSASYGVSLYKIVYRSADPYGQATLASGLLALPQNATKALPLLAYQHGTITLAADAPSAVVFDLPTLLAAASGYVVASADFLGFGESTGLHPYVHAKSLANAVVDLLRAARIHLGQSRVALNGQLFLAGYSEGGYATMAAHKEIETHYAAEFAVTAAAPGAGPYDLSGVMLSSALSGATVPDPYYFPYVLLTYNALYGLADSAAEIFAAPYAGTVPPLYDGKNGSAKINAALPASPRAVLNATFLAALDGGGENPLRSALRENDVYRWVPRAPVRLYHCAGDQSVPFKNSEVAHAYFRDHGAADATLVSLPGNDHGACALPVFAQVKAWFDGLLR